jgi:POT family proton-dependent oligopeptide transporter
VVLKNGKSAVISRELTVQFIYNVNYWYDFLLSLIQRRLANIRLSRVINVGGLAGVVTTLVEKHSGFGFAYLISLCLIVASAVAFQAGSMYFKFGKLSRSEDPRE